MEIKKAEFITSVADKKDLPFDDIPEIAFVGRSNVGKSSVINSLTGNVKLAKTSQTPGRTRLINYFSINNGSFRFVDLPGYGFASAGKQNKDLWSNLIEDYLLASKNLKLIVFLVDIRHDPTDLDSIMQNFLFTYSLPSVIVATKSDKIAKTQVKNYCQKIANGLHVGAANVIGYSIITNQGKKELLSKFDEALWGSNKK